MYISEIWYIETKNHSKSMDSIHTRRSDIKFGIYKVKQQGFLFFKKNFFSFKLQLLVHAADLRMSAQKMLKWLPWPHHYNKTSAWLCQHFPRWSYANPSPSSLFPHMCIFARIRTSGEWMILPEVCSPSLGTSSNSPRPQAEKHLCHICYLGFLTLKILELEL